MLLALIQKYPNISSALEIRRSRKQTTCTLSLILYRKQKQETRVMKPTWCPTYLQLTPSLYLYMFRAC
jgi:hypothetical protein